MNRPTIVERFADNGDHSHYALIDTETGELLWSEAPEEEIQELIDKSPTGSCMNIISEEGLSELYRIAYNDGFDHVGDKKDIIKHRRKQIKKIKKKYG